MSRFTWRKRILKISDISIMTENKEANQSTIYLVLLKWETLLKCGNAGSSRLLPCEKNLIWESLKLILLRNRYHSRTGVWGHRRLGVFQIEQLHSENWRGSDTWWASWELEDGCPNRPQSRRQSVIFSRFHKRRRKSSFLSCVPWAARKISAVFSHSARRTSRC